MAKSRAVDAVIVYEIIKRLSVPFDETDAFKLGLIDKNGKKLKSASTSEEKKAVTLFDRMIFNLKRILSKFGLTSKFSTFSAALFLLRESGEVRESDLLEVIAEERYINEYRQFNETNVTGAAVTGTGSDVASWVKRQKRKRHGKPIDGVSFLRRAKYQQIKREKQRNGLD